MSQECPAPGWWAAGGVALIVGALIFWWGRRVRGEHWRKAALAELARVHIIDPAHRVAHLSVVVRRVAITRFPRERVAALTGDAWLAFLDETLGEEARFRSAAGRVLLTAPYACGYPDDVTELVSLCERWVRGLPRRPAR